VRSSPGIVIALVRFVDGSRQWAKSCQALEMRETGRENAFCAHAILGASSMIEALEDLRVAETRSPRNRRTVASLRVTRYAR
jgi:hypothetical protein